MSQNDNVKVIKTLDNPLRFIFWEYNHVIFTAFFFLMGLIGSQSFIVSLISAISSFVIYKKIKNRLFRHFKRFSYWMFSAKNAKNFPPSFKRNYIH